MAGVENNYSCKGCGAIFTEEEILVHEDSCMKEAERNRAEEDKTGMPQKTSGITVFGGHGRQMMKKGLHVFTCSICGMDFCSKAELVVHNDSCLRKRAEEDKARRQRKASYKAVSGGHACEEFLCETGGKEVASLIAEKEKKGAGNEERVLKMFGFGTSLDDVPSQLWKAAKLLCFREFEWVVVFL